MGLGSFGEGWGTCALWPWACRGHTGLGLWVMIVLVFSPARPSLNAPGACGSLGEMPSVFTACVLPPGSLFPSGCLIQEQSRWCLAPKKPSEARPCPPTPAQCSVAHFSGGLRPGISWGAGPRYARGQFALPVACLASRVHRSLSSRVELSLTPASGLALATQDLCHPEQLTSRL